MVDIFGTSYRHLHLDLSKALPPSEPHAGKGFATPLGWGIGVLNMAVLMSTAHISPGTSLIPYHNRHPQFLDKKTEKQNGNVTFPSSH